VKPLQNEGEYDIYPSFKLKENQIFSGFESLAELLLKKKVVIIEGYVGVFYDQFRQRLDECLNSKGFKTSWINTSDYLKNPEVITEMISPFTGGNDPVFGKITSLKLEDFFNISSLKGLKPNPDAGLNLIIGPGATLAGWNGFIIYADLPKNEIQFRSRAGRITNLGSDLPADPKEMYKRFYFVDWIVLNKHKRDVLNKVDLFIDTQFVDLRRAPEAFLVGYQP